MIFRFSSNLEAPVENWRSSTSIARKGTPLPVYRPIGLLRTARTGRTTRGKDLTTLITGAAGFIGMHVAAALLDRGESVVGIDNFTPYYSVNLKNARVAHLEARSEARRVGTERVSTGRWGGWTWQ